MLTGETTKALPDAGSQVSRQGAGQGLSARYSISRRIEFCSGHRVYDHESKCRNLHGHNYVAYIHAVPRAALDNLGRVIDFSELKDRMKGWIDEYWDHGLVLWEGDKPAIEVAHLIPDQKLFLLPANPTAEVMCEYLLLTVAPRVMAGTDVFVTKVVLWETNNCYAEAELN